MQFPKKYTYRPITFFAIVFLCCLLPAPYIVYLSHQQEISVLLGLLFLFTLLSPASTTIGLIYSSGSTELKKDFLARLSVRTIKIKYLPYILFLMPIIVLLATTISLFFGQPWQQFTLAKEFTSLKGAGFVSLLIPLVIAPIWEEIGWRGYGVDSLRSRYNLFTTTLLFATLWALWHIPAFFIKGLYHYEELWSVSYLYVLNFFISIYPATTILNWVYYKNNRSIAAAVLFHSMLNLFSMLLQTTQTTKCIVTLLFCIVTGILIVCDKKFFFSKSLFDEKN